MEESELRWFVLLSDGSSLLIPATGLTLGRDPACDLVTRSAHVSRRQARIDLRAEGPCLTNIGRAPVLVDEKPVEGSMLVRDGQRIEAGGLRIRVMGQHAMEVESSPRWLLRSPDGPLIGVARSPFVVGSGPSVDLTLQGSPPLAAELRGLPRTLAVEFLATGTLDGILVEAGEVHALRPGVTMAWGPCALQVVTGGSYASLESTALDDDGLPSRVQLCFLPRGGRLSLTIAGRKQEFTVTGKRCDLVAALLRPPPPLTPGEFVSDEILLRRVWPTQPNMGRTNLNMLIHRLRRDFVRERIDGCHLIERAPLGGATRFRLLANAVVELA